MSQTIQGIYKDGTIALDRQPEGVAEARVIVEFLEPPAGAPAPPTRRRGIIRTGMFAPPNGQFTADAALEQTKQSWNAKLKELES